MNSWLRVKLTFAFLLAFQIRGWEPLSAQTLKIPNTIEETGSSAFAAVQKRFVKAPVVFLSTSELSAKSSRDCSSSSSQGVFETLSPSSSLGERTMMI
jgi:hypothetical protein